jgi:hypothetical protein
MRAKIDAINATYTGIGDKRQHTNAEDAIDRSDNQAAGGFTNQSGLPEDQRVQQYLIFFTDGNPNAFRDHFTYQGIDYDAVAYATWVTFDGSCDGLICRINPFGPSYLCDRDTGDTLLPPGLPGIPALPTGDGATSSTKWNVFGEYPVPGYGPNDNIPETILKPVWFKNVARQKAINHAQELKNNRIKIYTIGLGQVDKAFLSQIASGPGFEYYAPSSDQLEAIFQEIAKDIRLRLVA